MLNVFLANLRRLNRRHILPPLFVSRPAHRDTSNKSRMRVYLIDLSPVPDVTEPLVFDPFHTLWLDADRLEPFCEVLANAREAWLKQHGNRNSPHEFEVRATDGYGRVTAVVRRTVRRETA